MRTHRPPFFCWFTFVHLVPEAVSTPTGTESLRPLTFGQRA
jgi:hypothetical protein